MNPSDSVIILIWIARIVVLFFVVYLTPALVVRFFGRIF